MPRYELADGTSIPRPHTDTQAHTQPHQAVKTLEPLFVALLSAFLLREHLSVRRLVSLALLLVGVVIATTTEASFSLLGFGCTVAATFAKALQSVLSKSLVVHNQITPADLFAAAAVYALALLVPLWLLVDAPSLVAGEPPSLSGSGAAALARAQWIFSCCMSFPGERDLLDPPGKP